MQNKESLCFGFERTIGSSKRFVHVCYRIFPLFLAEVLGCLYIYILLNDKIYTDST